MRATATPRPASRNRARVAIQPARAIRQHSPPPPPRHRHHPTRNVAGMARSYIKGTHPPVGARHARDRDTGPGASGPARRPPHRARYAAAMNTPIVPERPPTIAGLYVLADTALLGARLESAVAAALRGGARVVQYRDKSADAARRVREAGALRALCRATGALLIVNDDPALAAAVGADGVHLGRDDPDPAGARARLGPAACIGVSCYGEIARAHAALAGGADHVAFGRFFPSQTKPGGPLLDEAFLRRAVAAVPAPVVAIGGISPDNAAPLVHAGAAALAVTAGVMAAPDIEAAARAIARLF